MWVVLVKFLLLILLTCRCQSEVKTCSPWFFDCENGKCIAEIWKCDGENDCGNFKDEENCEIPPTAKPCVSSQFQCKTADQHCIPEKWYCDGDPDCADGSDEAECNNATENCTGFVCNSHKCIPDKWRCDGNIDCPDGDDEETCPRAKLCTDSEFLCSSGLCILQNLVCNGKKDCADGSDEGPHCGDPCENATCSQNCKNTPTGPQCYCNEGYALDSKNNKTCNDIDECLEEGFCSHKCTNSKGSYKCSCHEGYELVNRTCRASGVNSVLIYSTRKEVRGIRLKSNEYFSVVQAVAVASAVDLDPQSNRVYWIDVSNKSSVYTAKMNGGSRQTVLSQGLLVPEDIAVDYIADNLYITDSGLRQVLVCNSDGRMCHVLHENVERPRSIVLDLDSRLMYWSDWGEHSRGIFRSGMDGSRRISMVSERIGWPNGIAIDHTTNRLYWADAKLNTIEFIALDGTLRKVLLNTTVYHPYSLAVFEDTLYWSDWATFTLESCNKFTGHKVTILSRQSDRRIMGVHVYDPVLTSKASNPCSYNDCSHMCLMSPVKDYSCACPHGFKLSTDGKTCRKEYGEAIFVSEGSKVFYIVPKMVGSESIAELPLRLGDALITRVAYDSKLRYIFVADMKKPAIYGINMTSWHMQELVGSYIGAPHDLSFDWKSNNLYWIDKAKGNVEVININNLRRVVILQDLLNPTAIATSPAEGYMFVATLGSSDRVSMYDMDGKNRKGLYFVQGLPISLALHPSKSILYWADRMTETIFYANYSRNGPAQAVKRRVSGLLSVSASDEYIYWTSLKRELNLMKGNVTQVLQLPGQGQRSVGRTVTYSSGATPAGLSMCLIGNGGCSYLCLTSSSGRTCACSSEMILSSDNVTCIARQCNDADFKCANGRCVSSEKRCDGIKDCADGSDEVACSRCSIDDFQCKNGRCILKTWQCDNRDDCGDHSDEEECPNSLTTCQKEYMTCLNGECVPIIWRCDKTEDCSDGSDELKCNETLCNVKDHVRCDNGQCISVSWLCDGTIDCVDESDEKNCSKQPPACSLGKFQCESDRSCIDEILRCDRRVDCVDASDEKNCLNAKRDCKSNEFPCKEGTCISTDELCDGHSDCKGNEDEMNCTLKTCRDNDWLCKDKCISQQWICDGDEDCADGSDEWNCYGATTSLPTLPPVPACDGFFCFTMNSCLPWSSVCDGRQDCSKPSDEGGLCSKSCSRGNGCSHICQKTPYGSKCFCNEGYSLLPDNKTCDDINECDEVGTCSHFCTNTRGSFKCSCAEGYVLHNDFRFCKAEGGSAKLLYLLKHQIRGFDLSSRLQTAYLNLEDVEMVGMDYNAAEGIFYWTDRFGTINSYSVISQQNEVINVLLSRPTTVKYDWIAKNLYYLDQTLSIGVCTKDVKMCKTLFPTSSVHLDSMTIAPTFGLMFWTVWADNRDHISGAVVKAEMDGSKRMPIVTSKLIHPTGITVDHVLQMIYWSDRHMNTLECADFNGFKRRRVVTSGVHPLAVAVFEDDIYWADRVEDKIMRCNRFIEEKCKPVTDTNSKTNFLLVAHEAMQPKVHNKCLNMSCQHMCVLTREDPVCLCKDGFEGNEICEPVPEITTSKFSISTLSPHSSTTELQCPEGYCIGGEKCIVVNGKFICNCSDPYSGEKCNAVVAANISKGDNTLVIAVILVVLVTGLIVLTTFLCFRNRERIQKVSESVTVKFRNPKSSRGDRLMETDDGNACEDIVLEQEDLYEKISEDSDYMLQNSEKSNFKTPYGRSSTSNRIAENIAGFFHNLKHNSALP